MRTYKLLVLLCAVFAGYYLAQEDGLKAAIASGLAFHFFVMTRLERRTA